MDRRMPKQPNSIEPVPHLCPAIAEVARVIRRNTKAGDEDRVYAIRLLREVQDGIHQLRYNDSERQVMLATKVDG